MTKDSRIGFIQVVCTLAVVILHSNGAFWTFSSTENYWENANVIECLFYFAVPIFFMISGITLFDYRDRYSTTEFFKKRFHKTVIPYFAWSIIGALFMWLKGELVLEPVSLINALINGKIITIYWFFPVLFSLYISFPLFAITSKKHRTEIFKLILIFALIINITIPFILNILKRFYDIKIAWPYKVITLAGYMFWPVCGYYLHNNTPTRKVKRIIYLLSFLGLLVHIIGTKMLSFQSGNIDETFKGYNNLPCVLYSTGIFLILNDIAELLMANNKLDRLFSKLCDYSFSIYLIHWYVLSVLLHFLQVDSRSIFWRLGAPIPVIFFSILIALIIRKIPVIRCIAP